MGHTKNTKYLLHTHLKILHFFQDVTNCSLYCFNHSCWIALTTLCNLAHFSLFSVLFDFWLLYYYLTIGLICKDLIGEVWCVLIKVYLSCNKEMWTASLKHKQKGKKNPDGYFRKYSSKKQFRGIKSLLLYCCIGIQTSWDLWGVKKETLLPETLSGIFPEYSEAGWTRCRPLRTRVGYAPATFFPPSGALDCSHPLVECHTLREEIPHQHPQTPSQVVLQILGCRPPGRLFALRRQGGGGWSGDAARNTAERRQSQQQSWIRPRVTH